MALDRTLVATALYSRHYCCYRYKLLYVVPLVVTCLCRTAFCSASQMQRLRATSAQPPVNAASYPNEEQRFDFRLLANAQNISNILNGLLDGYDKRLRPNYGGRPVEVGITIHVATISAVSEVEMDYTLDMYLRQHWMDPRLTFEGSNESLTIGIEMVKNIWVPDTFFPNEKRSFFHESTTHNSFLRITPTGQVLRSTRLTVTANCPMSLEHFPLDRQNCSLEIESYGYSTKDISYKWEKEDVSVSISEDINLAQFSIIGKPYNVKRVIDLSTGNYSRLTAYFAFKRNLGFYLIQIYLPSSLIVIISWVSFWLNREATQARVAIGVTTVLTMTTLMTSTNASMPKVSYVKSIDIYLGTCFIIVFASLLEYAAVGYLLKRVKMRREEREKTYAALPMLFGGGAAPAKGSSMPPLPFACLTGGSGASPLLRPPSQRGANSYSCSPNVLEMQSLSSLLSAGNNPSPDKRAPSVAHQAYAEELGCDCDFETMGADHHHRSDRVRRRYPRSAFRPSSIDKWSRIFFPLTFFAFHVVYWTVYLNAVEAEADSHQ